MDVRLINSFIAGTRRTFEAMFQVHALFGKPYVKTDEEGGDGIDVRFGLSGDSCGVIAHRYPVATAMHITETLTGEAVDAEHPRVREAFSQLAQHVAETIRSELKSLGVTLADPTLHRAGHDEAHDDEAAAIKTLVLPCDTSLGRFRVEAALRKA